jgi:Rod binding domain-containing protein
LPACSADLRGTGKAVYRVMISGTPTPSVFDVQALSKLKTDLRKDDPQALKATARQFEAVFL